MNEHLLNWLRVLSEQYNTEFYVTEKMYKLKSKSKEWCEFTDQIDTITIHTKPHSEKTWRHRLKYVEKTVARAIILAPVGFSCSINRKKGKTYHIFRLAFGYSLSNGRNYRKRYTAYFIKELNYGFFINRDDKLFQMKITFEPLTLNDPLLRKSLQSLFNVILKAKDDYKSSSTIRNEVDRLNICLSNEIRELDRLYILNHGQYAILHGQRQRSIRGEDAIEVEYFDKIEDILHKYKLSIVFQPLTFSVISFTGNIYKNGNPKLPF